MAPNGSTVHIIGAGIFGVAAALEFKRRGHDVALFDPGPLPHPLAASTNSTKMIRTDDGANAFYMDLMEECFLGWDRWNQDWGEALYHQTGFLVLAAELYGPGGFEHDSYQLLLQRGHAVEPLDWRRRWEKRYWPICAPVVPPPLPGAYGAVPAPANSLRDDQDREATPGQSGIARPSSDAHLFQHRVAVNRLRQ
jgi:glycine/D-amino acid oxidase-like deaminating enzyme